MTSAWSVPRIPGLRAGEWAAPVVTAPRAEDIGMRWEVHDEEQPAHHLHHGDLYVGEAYGTERDDRPAARWRSAVSDVRGTVTGCGTLLASFEQAKHELLQDYLKHLANHGLN